MGPNIIHLHHSYVSLLEGKWIYLKKRSESNLSLCIFEADLTNYYHFRAYYIWLMVTGTWMDYDFPETVGNVIIPTDELIFFRRLGLNHQADYWPPSQRIPLIQDSTKKLHYYPMKNHHFYASSSHEWMNFMRQDSKHNTWSHIT
jgi:hypothetical protein